MVGLMPTTKHIDIKLQYLFSYPNYVLSTGKRRLEYFSVTCSIVLNTLLLVQLGRHFQLPDTFGILISIGRLYGCD